MSTLFANIGSAFILGLLAPTTAVCVLPLYPGFISYLSNLLTKNPDTRKLPFKLSLIITLGIISFMFLFGLIFTGFLQISLTKVIGIITPIALIILALISLLLIFNINPGRFFPQIQTPRTKNPYLSAFLFGFFFSIIILPCNPLIIAAFFANTIASLDFLTNMLQFFAFAIGIAFPLIILAAISTVTGNSIVRFLISKKRLINFFSGLIMLIISLYYLFFVFFAPVANAETMLFVGEGCSHCRVVEDFISENNLENSSDLKTYEVYYDQTNQKIYQTISAKIGYTGGEVPLLVDNDNYVVGDVPIITYLDKKYLSADSEGATEPQSSQLSRQDSQILNKLIGDDKSTPSGVLPKIFILLAMILGVSGIFLIRPRRRP